MIMAIIIYPEGEAEGSVYTIPYYTMVNIL